MENIILQEKPFGIFIVPIPSKDQSDISNFSKVICKDINLLYMQYFIKNRSGCLFRGTHFNNLDSVLNNGVDVMPTDSHIFLSDSPCKAIEYGWERSEKGPRMILLIYNRLQLERTFVEIPSSSTTEEIEQLKKTYPTVEHSLSGDTIMLSRLKEDDRRRNTGYEYYYGYWIPSNPLDALVWIMLIGSFDPEEVAIIKSKIIQKN